MKRSHSILLLLVLSIFTEVVFAQHTQVQYLSGKGKDDVVMWDFMVSGGMKAGVWSKIPVPSNWEPQGFGKYNYGFDKEANKGKEVGTYKRKFKIDRDWKNKQINIVFEGVMTDAHVKVNGQSAGPVHQGSFYTFRYDITSLLKLGKENEVEITVEKHSANKSVNAAEREGDFWVFGGIFRPVFLEALPKDHLSRISIDAKADGHLQMQVLTEGEADQVELSLYDAAGNSVGETQQITLSQNSGLLSAVYGSPKLWSAEYPNLYRAEVRLLHKGKLVHQVEKKIGFRTIKVKERDGVYINGQKIKFKGVNRHSFHPQTGRTTSKQQSIHDVELIKEMNMNAVRMAHYPPDTHFLEVCDSLGLYVMNELGGWHGYYDTPTGTKLLKEMILESENNPSIIFWANGNEGGHNLELDSIFLSEDIQKRPLIHPWAVYGGFETTHYREYNYGIGSYDHGHNIVMPTEFLHGMFDGGHGAGIEDYWKAMWANPLSAGGFLWDFQDQGIIRTDKKDSVDTDGNRGADGIVGPYYQKEGSFYTIKEVWSPIYFEPREMTKEFDGNFLIENRYAFTNTAACTFTYTLRQFEKASGGDKEKEGTIVSPKIDPLQKGLLHVDLPTDWQSYDVLYLTATDPHGKDIFTWSFPISLPEKVAQRWTSQGKKKVKVEQTGDAYIVRVGEIRYTFNKTTGLLQEVSNSKGTIPLKNGPVLQEAVNNYKDFTLQQQGDTVVISSKFDKKESYNTLRWTIYPSGQLKMHVQYFPESYFTRFVGVSFDLPEEQMQGVEYMGRGPYRVWKNRMKGNEFGVWEKTYNDVATGEVPFEYPEFKGYHSNMYWTIFKLKNQIFKVFTDREDVFLRLYTPKEQKDTDWKNMEPTFPDGDISFMNGISAIGTKTQKPETTGPMGMKHVYYDFEKEPIRALHMVLYFDFSTE